MQRMFFRFLMVCLLIVLGLSSCSNPNASVEVEEAWVRAAIMTGAAAASQSSHNHDHHHDADHEASGGTSAAYMILRNPGNEAETLLAASSPAAATVEIHITTLDGDIMRMRPLGELPIPPGESVILEPAGIHLMLIGLERELVAGEAIDLTLTFAKAGPRTISVPVRAP